jgi:RNase P subunit RPR2
LDRKGIGGKMIVNNKGICCQNCGKLLVTFGKVRMIIPELSYQCVCGATGSFQHIVVDRSGKEKNEERRKEK